MTPADLHLPELIATLSARVAELEGARDNAMEEAAKVADDYHEKALAWAKNIRGLEQHLGETDSSRIAAAIRALKGGA